MKGLTDEEADHLQLVITTPPADRLRLRGPITSGRIAVRDRLASRGLLRVAVVDTPEYGALRCGHITDLGRLALRLHRCAGMVAA